MDIFFHPYFDVIDNTNLFIAQVVEGPFVQVTFSVGDCGGDISLANRLIKIDEELGLCQRYSTAAASHLPEVRANLEIITQSNQKDLNCEKYLKNIQIHLKKDAYIYKSIMYKALAESEWYCNVGWALNRGGSVPLNS
jgi:hypothetical protein